MGESTKMMIHACEKKLIKEKDMNDIFFIGGACSCNDYIIGKICGKSVLIFEYAKYT